MDQNLLPQVKTITSQDYSWWNTVIGSEKVLVYGKHYFASRNQNYQYKGGIIFLESKTGILSNKIPLLQVKYQLSNYQVQVFAVDN